MLFAAIMAGGSGVRMGNPEQPKQFLLLGGKPILIHTVEKFSRLNVFDRIIVLCPEAWLQQTKDMIEKYFPDYSERIMVIVGGAMRNDTIMNAIDYIEQSYQIDEDDILVTHDAVRPFVSVRIITENIKSAQEHGACDTVVPATDTIVESLDSVSISCIPDRRNLYQGQTPQSFRMLKLKELYGDLNENEKEGLTDACKILTSRGERVVLVRGDGQNIKITYPHDMRIARALLEENLHA